MSAPWKILHGDCLDELEWIASDSVDSIVTDPPYGLNFMGKHWDYDVPKVDVWRECLRVLKPGGHLLSFFGTRTYHRGVVQIEDAGFEIRDQIGWTYGSGFPKSLDVSKAIDKAAGAERAVVGHKTFADGTKARKTQKLGGNATFSDPVSRESNLNVTAPSTDAAKKWQGWGTALKPAWEPIVMARKPIVGTVANNFELYGLGGLNIDGCRVGTDSVNTHSRGSTEAYPKRVGEKTVEESGRKQDQREGLNHDDRIGRYPANLIHDGSDEVLAAFPQAPGQQANASRTAPSEKTNIVYGAMKRQGDFAEKRNDAGSAARFFYAAKANKKDREAGNLHPTVKPTDLMRYLCRLVTPAGGLVLDPFMGSGSTGKAALLEGFRFIGIDREAEYINIARARLERAEQDTEL